ncbi:hypothetical protein CY34DRAFT_806299 [Suillus luteus UH-Slu-Lm8-n1]|uniref:Uncharacterized protein n=1 Tax=Suillus luteus UH-Slu-Lm8-n1 TaxID=930992 RepID=A0A0D0ATD6_9AGAM|nr:hypothetical protein CY34DRAFT_806299 [Suillus luteus UH-Slu-Lm8-n1]
MHNRKLQQRFRARGHHKFQKVKLYWPTTTENNTEIHQTDAQLAGSGSLNCKQSSKGQNQTSSKPHVIKRKGHVLCRTRERCCHRVDLKDVACVNMRDSS